MLVLTRQRGQAIVIGNDVEITVVDLRGDKVRLGVNAPRDIAVHRREVYEAIRGENRAAAMLRPQDLAEVIPSASPAAAPAPAGRPTDPFLGAALEEARRALEEGGLPMGAVLVREGRIIGRGRDRRRQQGDPTAQATIDCLRQAGPQKTYADTTLYCTARPGPLGEGAVNQLGIPRIIVGDGGPDSGASDVPGSLGVALEIVADPACIQLRREFVAGHPGDWNDPPGHSA